MINVVLMTRRAEKDLESAPKHVLGKLLEWVATVETIGLEETRKRPGWHDEPLKGQRKGQRSVRLNKKWRAIYIVREDGSVEYVEVQEVTPHDY
jgi:proteic killer suppression protein